RDGFTVNYGYDVVGHLAQMTDAAGAVIAGFHYDSAGRLQRKDLGNGAFTTYEYDAVGQLLHLVNHAPDQSINSRFDYVYDALGRVVTMTTLDGLTTYGYD